MRYVRISWRHDHVGEPTTLYSEVDDERREVRKVEVFSNGRCGYASVLASAGGTRLGEVPMPELGTIAADPQFGPAEITAAEFEAVWSERLSRGIQ